MMLKVFGLIPYKTISQVLFENSELTHSYSEDADGWMKGYSDVKLHKVRDVTYTITKPSKAPKSTTSPIIIYAKGNNWDLGWFHRKPYMVSPSAPVRDGVERRSLAQIMADSTGCTVVCFEYPGYGVDDPKNVSTTAAPQYMKRVIMYFRNAIPSRPIVLWGYSLGAAVVLRTLELLGEEAGEQVAGAVLQSSFVTLRDCGLNTIQRAMLWSMRGDARAGDYGLLRGARHAGVPLVWIHGTEDKLCPMDVVKQKVYSRYPHQKLFLELKGSAHNNLPLSAEWEGSCREALRFIIGSVEHSS